MSEVQKRPEELWWPSVEGLENGAITAGEKPAEVTKALQEDIATQKVLNRIWTLKDLPRTMLVGHTMWLVKWAGSALEGTKNLLAGTGEFIGVWVAKLVHEWGDSLLQYANEKTQGVRDMVNVAGEAIAVTAFEAMNGDHSIITGAIRYWKEKGVELARLPPEKQTELMASFQAQIALGVIGSRGLGAASKTAALSNEISLGGKVLDKAVSIGAKVGTEMAGLDSGALKNTDTPGINMVSDKPIWTIADNIGHGATANTDAFRDHIFIDPKNVPKNMQWSQWYVDQQGHLLINAEEWNGMSFTEKKNFVTHERTHQMMLRQSTQQMQALVQDFTSHPQWRWLQQEGKSLMGKNAGNATDADIVNELVAHRMWDRRVWEISGMSEVIDFVLWKHPEFTTSIRQLKEQIAKDPVNVALELQAAARTNMVQDQMRMIQDATLLKRLDPGFPERQHNANYHEMLTRIAGGLTSKVDNILAELSGERTPLLQEAGFEGLTRERLENIKTGLWTQEQSISQKLTDVHTVYQRMCEPGTNYSSEVKEKVWSAQSRLHNEFNRAKNFLQWPEMTRAETRIRKMEEKQWKENALRQREKDMPTREVTTHRPESASPDNTGMDAATKDSQTTSEPTKNLYQTKTTPKQTTPSDQPPENKPSYEERLSMNTRENYKFEQLSREGKASVLLSDMNFNLSEYNADRFFNLIFDELDPAIRDQFTPDVMARFGRDSNGVLLPNKGSLSDKIAKAEVRSGISHETVMYNAGLPDDDRLALAAQLVGKELTQPQKDTILRLHKDESKGVYQNGHAELRTMVKELDKVGISREKTRELIENGVLGSWDSRGGSALRLRDDVWNLSPRNLEPSVNTNAIPKLEGKKPHEAANIFREEAETITNPRSNLESILAHTDPNDTILYHGLNAKANTWTEARLDNIKNIVEYIENAHNSGLSEWEVVSAKVHLKNKVEKDAIVPLAQQIHTLETSGKFTLSEQNYAKLRNLVNRLEQIHLNPPE